MNAPARLQSLPAIEAAIWHELGRAAKDQQHPWRFAVLATSASSGLAAARTVVLRETDAAARCLVIYTDARAAKVAQLRAQPQALLVMWSPRLSWQLRLQVTVEVHTDGLAATSRWATLRSSPAANDYLAPQAPGELLDPALRVADAAEHRHHFAVLMAQVRAIDWLELHPQGHRRAAFDAEGARWLVP